MRYKKYLSITEHFVLIVLFLIVLAQWTTATEKETNITLNEPQPWYSIAKPNVCRLKDEGILIVYVAGYHVGQILGRISYDNGKNWGNIFPVGQLYGDTPKCIGLDDGSFLVTVSRWENTDLNQCEYSLGYNNGRSWTTPRPISINKIGFCSSIDQIGKDVYLCGGNWALNYSHSQYSNPQPTLWRYNPVKRTFTLVHQFDSKVHSEWDFVELNKNHWVGYFRGNDNKTTRMESFDMGHTWVNETIIEDLGYITYIGVDKLSNEKYILFGILRNETGYGELMYRLSDDGFDWEDKNVIQQASAKGNTLGGASLLDCGESIIFFYHFGVKGGDIDIYQKEIEYAI